MQQTAVEKRSDTWLAPDRASVPKMLTLSARRPINTRMGINEMKILLRALIFILAFLFPAGLCPQM